MLTRNVDTTYADSGTDPSIQIHQADHDVIHSQLYRPANHRYPRRPYNQTMIWGGQTGHPYTTTGGTGATFNLNDTTDFVLGDRSIKITTNGAGANTFVRVLNGTAMDFTNRVPRVWVKFDNPTTGLDFRLWLGSGGALANAYKWQMLDLAANPFYAAGEWVQLTLPWSAAVVAGTPTRNALTDVNFQVFDNSGGTGSVVHWGGFASVPDTNAMWPNGVVSLTFDDAYTTTYTVAKAYMDKYGYAGTLYPIIDVIDGGNTNYLRLSQMKELVTRSGWDVGLHAYTAANHDQAAGITSSSAANQVLDIVQSREWLVGNGFSVPSHYAYPQGFFNQATATNLAPWVASARTTKPRTETWPPSDRMRMYTRALSNTDTAANITAFIDQVKTNKEWLILTFHDLVSPATAGTATTPAIFQTIIDYLNTQAVPVRTVSEVLAANPGL